MTEQQVRNNICIAVPRTSSHRLCISQILELIRGKKHFMDVTDGDLDNLDSFAPVPLMSPPAGVTHQVLVEPILSNVSESSMESFLTEFSSFRTRYYQSQSGKESGDWLFAQVKALLNRYPSDRYKTSVRQFKHSFPQSSVIARIEPVSADANAPIVIVGAHQDSVNQWNPWFGRSPGADDDGSGTATILESLSAILESGVLNSEGWTKPIEYHWYAAEEGGLLGSQKVAADYRERGAKVYAMWQCDMTGYQPPNLAEVIGVSTDFVDPPFSKYVKLLVETYGGVKAVDTKCGYGCSDHASWYKAGYPAVFTFEALFENSSPYIHTSNDDVSHISFSHMAKFAKVIVGWTIELSFD
ncbi:hypothetical protein BJ742DRAFT_672451 [Cladochytrium replicatum]|nr:hypothetical protein BJ742DRAFT_672451 [Cladochytrium replicatum]